MNKINEDKNSTLQIRYTTIVIWYITIRIDIQYYNKNWYTTIRIRYTMITINLLQ
jgi:hypothetical protein